MKRFYSRKELEEEIQKRLYEEHRERNNSRRFDEIESRLYKLCEKVDLLQEQLNRNTHND